MTFNKKAALELSITAIVVLIIAITVLGLAIGFITKYFKIGEKGVAGTLDQVEQLTLTRIQESGELLVLSLPENEVTIGKQLEGFIGVRNSASNPEGEKICFRVEVRCIKPFEVGSFCDSKKQVNDIVVGGYDPDNGWLPVGTDRNWFRSLLAEFDLKNQEMAVYPVELLVRGVRPDIYNMEMNVYKDPENKECSQQSFSDKKEALYATHPFNLKVVG